MNTWEDRWNQMINKNFLTNKKKEEKKFIPKGRKNKTINKDFINLCKKSQKEMKTYLAEELKKYYKNVISKDGFLYVKGKDNILLTAHMDTTLHVEYGERVPVKDFYEEYKDNKHIITSPQGIGGDDRCGIYVIMKILQTTDLRPSIVFNEDEEIGCIGSTKFANSKFNKDIENMLFVIQIDRRGKDDAVFYQDRNEDFHKFVTESTGYVERFGSYTDICKICPASKVSGVNLSSGYYNEHHQDESVVLEELEHTYEITIKLIKDGLERKEQFEYKTYQNFYRWNDEDYGTYYRGYYDRYRERFNVQTNNYSAYSRLLEKNDEDEIDEEELCAMYISYIDENGEEIEEMIEGDDENEMFVDFFMNHPDICWNQILDYSYDFEDNSSSMLH